MAIEMTYGNFFLLSLFYFWASSTSLSLGIGYYTVYRPIIAGMVTGLILKDVQTGMQAGALINIIYIDFVSTGGSFKGDQCLTAIIAATAAILFSLDPIEAAAIAFPFGFLGILIWKYRLKINNIFVRIYEKNTGKISFLTYAFTMVFCPSCFSI
ncbi:MAG TPA: PTS sugar transporter subunit IIC [Tissierellia bacterium]|nr:PTS sugar transporter subunit IIC [Tissierellia bacterium]